MQPFKGNQEASGHIQNIFLSILKLAHCFNYNINKYLYWKTSGKNGWDLFGQSADIMAQIPQANPSHRPWFINYNKPYYVYCTLGQHDQWHRYSSMLTCYAGLLYLGFKPRMFSISFRCHLADSSLPSVEQIQLTSLQLYTYFREVSSINSGGLASRASTW